MIGNFLVELEILADNSIVYTSMRARFDMRVVRRIDTPQRLNLVPVVINEAGQVDIRTAGVTRFLLLMWRS